MTGEGRVGRGAPFADGALGAEKGDGHRARREQVGRWPQRRVEQAEGDGAQRGGVEFPEGHARRLPQLLELFVRDGAAREAVSIEERPKLEELEAVGDERIADHEGECLVDDSATLVPRLSDGPARRRHREDPCSDDGDDHGVEHVGQRELCKDRSLEFGVGIMALPTQGLDQGASQSGWVEQIKKQEA